MPASHGEVIFDQTVTGMDYLDCSRQTLSRLSFALRDVYGTVIAVNENHVAFSIVFSRVQDGSYFFWISIYRMPREAKITAVPIDVQPGLTLEQVDGQEPKTEAEKMTDVINEVNVIESTLSNEDESSIQKAPKARAKRASIKEAVMTEPEVEATSSFDEVQAEVVMPKQEPYVELKVA